LHHVGHAGDNVEELASVPVKVREKKNYAYISFNEKNRLWGLKA